MILLLAFGAVVAAAVPLLLGLTSVAAAMGAFGVISQFAPDGGSGGALVVLIGLAVGVDYSLFYIRREREERRAGKGAHAALDAAAATIGRAIVVSGVTVMVALAGLLFTGLAVFTSMALATIVVVAIAVIGSVTVLPATLALLGDRIDKGRLPFLGRRRAARRRRRVGTARAHGHAPPVVALVTAVCLLGTLAIPALELQPASTLRVVAPERHAGRGRAARDRARLPGRAERRRARRDGARARRARRAGRAARARRAGARGHRRARVGRRRDGARRSHGGRLGADARPRHRRPRRTRSRRCASASPRPRARSRRAPRRSLTGDAAGSADFTHRLATSTPLVIGIVLGLAFLLLVAAFRSPRLAAAVIALNLLSVGAAYGVLAAVFQHDWAEGLLGFTSTGTVADWLPLFAFVILFGLSMDYTILVLERVREARRAGRSAREAAAEGVAATGEHGDQCCDRDGRRVRDLRHDAVRRQQAARRRARASRSCSTRRSCAGSRCRPPSRCSATAARGAAKARRGGLG